MLSTAGLHENYRVISHAQDYLLVDKPAGSSVHREAENCSLLDHIRADQQLDYLAPVHRLDKITSGLWLLAKTPKAAAELSEQFAQRSVEKFYLALSDRKPRKKQGSVEGALLKARGGSYRLARQGQPWSYTQFFSYGLGDGHRLFLLKPLTGRTHQIRVVMKSLGAPIVGDSRYHSSEKHAFKNNASKNSASINNGSEDQALNDAGSVETPDRGYLHAYALCFTFAGQRLRFVAAPREGRLFTSDACCARLAELAEPWSLNWPGQPKNIDTLDLKVRILP